MNLAQLQNMLARLIGVQNIADDPEVAAWATDALNQAQHEVAVDLQIPRSNTLVLGSVGSVSLPPNIQSWGVLAVYDRTNGNPLSIVEESRGLAEGLLTPASGTPVYAVYRHYANTLTLTPTPLAPVDVYIYYAYIPPDMSAPSDAPWDNQYRDYHSIVAMKAALLIHESDWADPRRVEWVMQRYALRLQRFRQRIESEKDTKPRSEVELHDAPRA